MAENAKFSHESGGMAQHDNAIVVIETVPDVKFEGEDPFKHFEGSINEEQWQTWQQMNQQVRGLVEMSDEEQSEDENLLIDDALLVSAAKELHSSQDPVDTHSSPLPRDPHSTTGSSQTPQPSTSGSSPSKPVLNFMLPPGYRLEPTLQYLSGKISFLEFSEMMEKKAVDEGLKVVEDVPEVAQASEEEEAGYVDNTQADPDFTCSLDKQSKQKKEKEKSSVQSEKKTMKKTRRRITDLPRHLQHEMGEVNMTFAKGNHAEAIQKCNEIIRQAPRATKPFQTLGMLYEDLGDPEKALQYYLIAAYLDPGDADEWGRLAEMALEISDVSQAIKCYNQAIKADKTRTDYLWQRSRLYEELKEYKKAVEGYQTILKLLPAESAEEYFKLALSVTRSFYELGEKSLALQTMRQAFKDHPEQITSEDVNLLLELQIPARQYKESLQILVKQCGVTFTFPSGKVWSCDTDQVALQLVEDKVLPIRCSIPDILPVDLRVKLSVCMIHQGYHKLVKDVIAPLFEEDIEEYGDLYLDVAEAYMEEGFYSDARPILNMLVGSTNYNLAAVWLRYGECLKSLGELPAAVKAYKNVVLLAPGHIGARMALSALQQHLGKHDEALEALQHGEQEDKTLTEEEEQMLIQKCHLLNTQGKLDELLETVKQLVFADWRWIFTIERAILHANKSCKHRKDALKAHLEKIGRDSAAVFSDTHRKKMTDSSVNDVFDIIKMVCKALIAAKRYDDYEDLVLHCMWCPRFMEHPSLIKDLEFYVVTAGALKKNSFYAYTFCKEYLHESLDNNQAWNLFHQITMMGNDARQNRFCLRKIMQCPDNIPLGIMNGHNSMVTGSYKHSLGEYSTVFRRCPTDPMLSLCIGLDFIHCASQRFAAKRHSLIMQGLMFLNNYLELRGECQETYYNLGRALHQLDVLFVAVYYYKKALTFPPVIQHDGGMYDLRGEISYNLALIYQNSGATEYARHLLYQHCVI